MTKSIFIIIAFAIFVNCSSNDEVIVVDPIIIATPTESIYFPPLTDTNWETKSITVLNWKQSGVQPLLDYLQLKNTKSFIVLVNGRIVLENYFNGHSKTSPWYWVSCWAHKLCEKNIRKKM